MVNPDRPMRVKFHYRYNEESWGRGRSRPCRGSFDHVLPDIGAHAEHVADMPSAMAGALAGDATAVPVVPLLRWDDTFYEGVVDGDAFLSSPDPGDALVARFGGRRLFDARSAPWLPGTTNADKVDRHDQRKADAMRDALVDARRFVLSGGRLHVAVSEPVIAITPAGPRVTCQDGGPQTAFRLDEAAAAVEEARRRGLPHALDGVDVHEPSALRKDPVTRRLRSAAGAYASEMSGALGFAPRATVAAYAALRDALGTYERPGDPEAIHAALAPALAARDGDATEAHASASQAMGAYELRAALAPAERRVMAP